MEIKNMDSPLAPASNVQRSLNLIFNFFKSPLMFKCQRETFFPSQRIWYYSIWGKILLNTKLNKAN